MKVVIFDMDGTLIDSKKDITISINHVRKVNYNLAPLSEEFVVEAINMHDRNLAKLFYETDIYLRRDKNLFEKHYNSQCIENVYLYEGVAQMLERLRHEGIKLSVATNAPTKFAKRMLEHLKVSSFFDKIIGADMVSESKPSPEMLNMILEHYDFDINAHKGWMVGDNSKDVLSAKSAGLKPIFVTWGFARESDENVVAKKPSEVLDIVL